MSDDHLIEHGPWTIDVDPNGGGVMVNDTRIEGTLRESVTLTPEEAGWLFRVAGPMVLIALRDAQQNAEPKREKR